MADRALNDSDAEDWQFETEADGLASDNAIWSHSDYDGVEATCLFIQHLLQKFRAEGRATFAWSHDCSKLCTDAYGGRAAVITTQEIRTMGTAQWLAQNTG